MAELRHPAFFDGGESHRRVDEALAAADVGRVVLDTRPLYRTAPGTDASVDERRTKPNLPIVTDVIGGEPILRVIGPDDRDDTLNGAAAWAEQVIDRIGEGRRPYLFVHQPENLDSPALARRFHEHVAGITDLAALPAAELRDTSGQAPLF